MNILKSVSNISNLELELTLFNSKRALSNIEKKLETLQVGKSILLKDTASPQSIYYNRIKGFGPTDLDKLDLILDIYEQDQIIPCFDLTPNQSNFEVAKSLTNKGFFCAEQLAFLEITPNSFLSSNNQLKIVQVTEENAVDFINQIGLSTGMEYEDELIKQKSEYFYRPNFKNYLAYFGEQVAGMGSLFISEDKGYIANDFTFPEFRGKGCQTALINYRLHLATEMGLEKVYTDVEFGSTSHQNMAKIGFELVFVNSFWMRG